MTTVIDRPSETAEETGTDEGHGIARQAPAPGQARGERRWAESHGADGLAAALGWFSLGLGAAELAAPRMMARVIGIEDTPRNRALLRGFGARELASGAGILTSTRPGGWVWSRVAGDAIDLAFLGAAARGRGARRSRVGMAALAVAGVTALDVLSGRRLASRTPRAGRDRGVDVRATVTIAASPSDVYRFWRDLSNLPRFMTHLQSVEEQGARSHWTAAGPAGTGVKWVSEIVEERPDELIAWRSLEGDVDHSGRVVFRAAPGERGTEVHLQARFLPPGGVVGSAVAHLLDGVARTKLRADLLRLKQILETGEIVRSDASIASGPHPARPSGPEEVRS
jgi:uncharacterized membrane protein